MTRTTTVSVSGDEGLSQVLFGAGLAAWTPLDWEYTGDPPFDAAGIAVFVDGRFVVESLTLKRVDGGPPITNEQLRLVPVAELVRKGIKRAVEVSVRTSGVMLGLSSDWTDVAELRKAGATDETLQYVSARYRMAYACWDPATDAVADAIGVSRATAGRWIAKARRAGYLGPAVGTKAGEMSMVSHTTQEG